MPASPPITPEQIDQFGEQGYFVTEPLFDAGTLDRLIEACERVQAETDALPLHTQHLALTIQEKLYAEGRIGNGLRVLERLHKKSPICRRVCVSSDLVKIAVALLGPEVRLYWNHAVLNLPREGAGFVWHQDSAYAPPKAQEFVCCWVALDDATLENGCLRVLPGSHRWGLQQHRRHEERDEVQGYQGEDEGVPLPVRRGQVVVSSSLLLHCSGPNRTDTHRRAYLINYAATHTVTINPLTGKPRGNNLPVASGGQMLYPEPGP